MRRLTMLGLLVVVSGCTPGARFVQVNPQGGVVAIPANTNSWPNNYRDKALALIDQECPNGYVIEREEEVVVGKTTNTHEHRNTSEQPAAVLSVTEDPRQEAEPSFSIIGLGDVQERTHRTMTTTDQTEWRIYYRRATPLLQQGPAVPE